jgi:hypothetical protein
MHHHYALGFFGRVDWTFMGLNTLMLALHRLHPLPDGRARGHVRAGEVRGTATLFYAATFFVTGVLTNIAWRYAGSGRRLIEGRVADSELKGISKTFLVGPIAYGAATLMALASAWASIAICAALAVLYAFPALLAGLRAALSPGGRQLMLVMASLAQARNFKGPPGV